MNNYSDNREHAVQPIAGTANSSDVIVTANNTNIPSVANGTSRAGTTYWTPLCWTSNGIEHDVRIVTEANGLIGAVRSGAAYDPSDIRLEGLTIPGAANCHSHTFHRALRGIDFAGGNFWSWRDTMYAIASRLTPDLYFRYAKAVYTEMLLAGYTTVAEFHYIHHQLSGQSYNDPNAMGKALIAAAQEVGIRLTLLDTCYLHADVAGSPLNAKQQRFSDQSPEAWLERVAALERNLDDAQRQTIRIGAAAHSVRACSPQDARIIADWSRESLALGAEPRPVHIHLSEQVAENKDCLRHSGMTPAALMQTIGFWGGNACAVHATHLTADDITLLAASGASVAFCPTTEANLADGIGPAAAMRDAGIKLCIGSDENVRIDPFEEIRQLDAHERLLSGRRDAFSCAELVNIMTANGQRSCGWKNAGSVQENALADFVTLDIANSPRIAGADLQNIPFVASASDVRYVVVGGKLVVNQGMHAAEASAREIALLTKQLRD
ncbi:formimidoylglutamate deiminase [Bifidobacterium subtile]|uniref:Formiminoglutamate deiminase n=1 Tax=Bifidobacterium subtile TaxID=77635 RepID=A0A087E7L8_9BIFI|nr:formimidoylglutamate deiminase [Bifidobacterium subtile]KFJ03769.1 formiminoglutamate deiminase [Bifidobacterium subtile]QOL36160.1 formimidoylglutamate deiminase [Bifidobacterium subtile]